MIVQTHIDDLNFMLMDKRILVWIALILLTIGSPNFSPTMTQPVQARSFSANITEITQDGITAAIIVQDANGNVLTSNDSVNVGDRISYELTLTNGGEQAITSIVMVDVFPVGAFTEISCGGCSRAENETVTQEVSWDIATVAGGGSTTQTLSARVAAGTGLTTLSNQLFYSYQINNVVFNGQTSGPTLKVSALPSADSDSQISNNAIWFSEEHTEARSAHWSDFDSDGDLDIALGIVDDTVVYRNLGTQFVLFWRNARAVTQVRWVDIDNDDQVELIGMGGLFQQENQDGETSQISENYIYQYLPNSNLINNRFQQTAAFTTTELIAKVEVADFNLDSYQDLIVSTENINATCGVRLLLNNQAGNFTTPGTCLSRIPATALSAGDLDNDGDIDVALGLWPNKLRFLRNRGIQSDGTDNTTETTPDVLLVPDATLNSLATINRLTPFPPFDLSWGDYNRDGFFDLAAAYPRQREVHIYTNQNGLSFAPPVIIHTDAMMTPRALEWGDLNGDGRLDILVGDGRPMGYTQHDNLHTTQIGVTDVFTRFFTTSDSVHYQIVDIFGIDQSNNGRLDLGLIDQFRQSSMLPNYYSYLSDHMDPLEHFPGQSTTPASSVAWGDVDNDGDLDLLFGAGDVTGGAAAVGSKLYENQDGDFFADRLYSGSAGFGPHEVAFADWNLDNRLDVVVGDTTQGNIYYDDDIAESDWKALIGLDLDIESSGHVALVLGDVYGDADIDMLIGADGPLEGDAAIALYPNFFADACAADLTAFRLNCTDPFDVWRTKDVDNLRGLAWGDFNNDELLDFAVGFKERPVRVYQNQGYNTFEIAWTSSFTPTTLSLAWADYDSDGTQELTLGNSGSPIQIYDVSADQLEWEASATYSTTSVAWGDIDNDGDLDLAVGNYDAPDQVYLNTEGDLTSLWTSSEVLQTTDLAWGDADEDGDLDLAVSQDGDAANGIYHNNYIVPSHLTLDFLEEMPLRNQPTYVSVDRPGNLSNAYDRSSAEILSGPRHPTVTIRYLLFDPDGIRNDTEPNAVGDHVIRTLFDYSLDNGSTWQTATPVGGTSNTMTQTSRLGIEGVFHWNAVTDQAISDEARFRVTAIHTNPSGIAHRILTRGVSPPFRVRGTTCIWPESPKIIVRQNQQFIPVATLAELLPTFFALSATDQRNYIIDQLITHVGIESENSLQLIGGVQDGSGTLTFQWTIQRIDPVQSWTFNSQIIPMTLSDGIYNVELSVSGEACPQTWPQPRKNAISTLLIVDDGIPERVFLPTVLTSIDAEGDTSGVSDAVDASGDDVQVHRDNRSTDGVNLHAGVATPDHTAKQSLALIQQVKDVAGVTNADGTTLIWDNAHPVPSPDTAKSASDTYLKVEGYKIYRSPQESTPDYEAIAILPPEQNTYFDSDGHCGYSYYVTVFGRYFADARLSDPNGEGVFTESLPSFYSYFTPSCYLN
ncbi:MAG: FG-GAP-like repeat-containing protein [Chloroflexota bacterium]